jgi:hypothetical protein
MSKNDEQYYTTKMEDKHKRKRGLASIFKHLPSPLREKCKTGALPAELTARKLFSL